MLTHTETTQVCDCKVKQMFIVPKAQTLQTKAVQYCKYIRHPDIALNYFILCQRADVATTSSLVRKRLVLNPLGSISLLIAVCL